MTTLAIYDDKNERLLCELPRERDLRPAVGNELRLLRCVGHGGEPDVEAVGGDGSDGSDLWRVVRVRHVIIFAPGPTYSVVTQVFAESLGRSE